MKKLNLGCGKDIKEGYINLDIVKLPKVDIVHNLNKYPYPFKDNEFDEISCDSVLEHLEDIKNPMEELWRISKKGAKIIITVPMFPSVWAMADPTHKSFYTYFTFNYFREEDYLNYYTKARFKILKRRIVFWSPFSFLTTLVNLSELSKKAYAHFFSMLIPANELRVVLEVVK
jgi:predicted SAM-dependent methyltransferase